MLIESALAHLLGRIIQSHDPGSRLHEPSVRNHECVLAEPVVDPDGDIPAKLDVLFLVIADRNHIRIVEEDIGRHQDRIGQKACSNRFLAAALGLELGHAVELSGVAAAAEDPSQLRVSADGGLDEDDGFLRIDADGHIEGRHIQDVLSQFLRILGNGDSMLIYDAVDALVVILQLDELLECAQIITEVNVSCRLYAGKYALHSFLFSPVDYSSSSGS